MTSKVLHGARACLWMGTTPIGIFGSCSWQIAYDVSPAWLLGRYSAGELVYTGAEVVNLSMTGFRVVGHGPFSVADKASGARMVPRLQDLMTYEDITVTIHDRAEPDPEKSLIMTVKNVKPSGVNSSVAARSLSEVSINAVGLNFGDEEGEHVENPSAMKLPG